MDVRNNLEVGEGRRIIVLCSLICVRYTCRGKQKGRSIKYGTSKRCGTTKGETRLIYPVSIRILLK